MSATKPAILITGSDLAAAAVDLLTDFRLVFAGKAPQQDELIALVGAHDPVAIIVRYGVIT